MKISTSIIKYIDDKTFFLDIVSPEGIAIDWISRRIYWTDSSKDTIEVASLDNGTVRAIVIKTGLVNPRGIAVDPNQKYVFYFVYILWIIIRIKINKFSFCHLVNYIGLTGTEQVQKLNKRIWMDQIA